MQLLEEDNLLDYLRATGRLAPGETATARMLAGGVSNVVFYVERSPADQLAGAADFVVKQARGRLRVAQTWLCPVERIFREVDVLRACAALLREFPASQPAGCPGIVATTPTVLWEDREQFAFAMTAAPPGHRTWKADLLAGGADPRIAAACGQLLGRLHAASWQRAELARQFADRQYFDLLRVDPYYRRIAAVHADLQPWIDRLIASLEAHCVCLVHGDFSPKNLLVYDSSAIAPAQQLMLIDCEVGHWGDPAFDLGFFLTHLVLKELWHRGQPQGLPPGQMLNLCGEFLAAYAREVQPVAGEAYPPLEQRAVEHLAGCLLARVDGKSPVEYLHDERERDVVRRLARKLGAGSRATLTEALRWTAAMFATYLPPGHES